MGGGIVWDSTSTDEFNEALLKARVLTERPVEFSLFETILWTPNEGYFLLDKHIARMADSAEYFDFSFSRERLVDFLTLATGSFTSPKRVKILVNHSGEFSEETVDFLSEVRMFKACLANHSVNSNNVFLFHKTTHREIYPSPPKGYDDVLLFNENGELTEFTIGNLVVEIDNERFTPPVTCGLLPGTFRRWLLETGQIQERILHRDELATSSKIFLVNSLRKWVEVNLKMQPT